MAVALLADSAEPCFVQVDIWPPPLEGKANELVPFSAPPISGYGTSFVEIIVQLRKTNNDYCDAEVWDDMEKTCAMADKRDWNIPTESHILYKGDSSI